MFVTVTYLKKSDGVALKAVPVAFKWGIMLKELGYDDVESDSAAQNRHICGIL